MASRHPDKYDFLVDVNLPKMFSFFNYSNFAHIVDINPMMTDDEVWNYALKNNQVILTKDADFYDKYMNYFVAVVSDKQFQSKSTICCIKQRAGTITGSQNPRIAFFLLLLYLFSLLPNA